MKTAKTLIIINAVMIIIAACTASRKTVTTTAPATTTSPSIPLVLVNPESKIYAPGNEELAAIQEQYKDVTLNQLKTGYFIYTEGACVKCHNAEQNVNKYDETQWKNIMNDMAERAMLSDAEKNAVYKYVLAMKVSKPKDATCQK